MLEIKRILLSYKTMVLFFLLFILHGIFFFYQCNDLKQNTLWGESLQNYIDGYPEYIQSVLENAGEMLENPLFSHSQSFVYRNVQKTARDYSRLQAVTPIYGENRGIITVLGFQLTDYLLLLFGIYLITTCMLDREKGLHLLIRSTYRGRMPITLERIASLTLGALAATFLLYGESLGISLLLYPGSDLTRPLQSIPEFCGYPMTCTISRYLLYFFLRRFLGILLTCLLLLLCLSLLSSALSLFLFGGLLMGEYLLYILLLPTAKGAIFKYVNLYTLVFQGLDYGHYYNLNIWGRPFSPEHFATLLGTGMVFILTFLCLLRFSKQYPALTKRRSPLSEKLSILWDKRKPFLTPFLWEAKKIFISQKGIFIFALTLFLAWSGARELSYFDYRTHYVTDWYRDFNGPVSDTLVQQIADKEDALVNKLGRLEASLEVRYENLVIYGEKGLDTSMVEANIVKLKFAISEQNKKIQGIRVVKEQAIRALAAGQKLGRDLELIEPACYELLLDKDKKTVRQNYLYILLTIILLFSGTMACEKTAHMDRILPTLYHGRFPLLLRKIILVALMSIFCGLAFHMVQLLEIGRALPYHDLGALIQSVPCMIGFPFAITIRTYLVLLYSARLLLSFLMGMAVLTISNYSKSRVSTIALSVFILLIPMVILSVLTS